MEMPRLARKNILATGNQSGMYGHSGSPYDYIEAGIFAELHVQPRIEPLIRSLPEIISGLRKNSTHAQAIVAETWVSALKEYGCCKNRQQPSGDN